MFESTRVEVVRLPINLILSGDELPTRVPYYCIRCKSYIFSVNRDIMAIWMGEGYPMREIPKGMGWIQFYCHGCKRDYNFYLQ